MEDQALLLDDIMAWDVQGTIAARPAAGKRGRYYTSTDETDGPILYRDTGAAWMRVTPNPTYSCKLVYTGTSVNKSHVTDASGWSGVSAIGTALGTWTERYDTHPSGMHSTVSNQNRIVIPHAGKWRYHGRISFGLSTLGYTTGTADRRAIALRGLRGAAAYARRNESVISVQAGGLIETIEIEVEDLFSANDYLGLEFDIGAAASGTVPMYGSTAFGNVGEYTTEFDCHLISTL
jgi:hypothetical protein